MKGKYSQKVSDYYDDREDEMKKSYDISRKYEHKLTKDKNDRNILELFDSDKKSVHRGEYEIIGIYDLTTSVWYWGWNIDLVDRTLVKSIDAVKEITNEVKKNHSKYESREADYLHFISSNGNFFTIPDRLQGIIKVAMFETKAKWYVPIVYTADESSYVQSDEKSLDPQAQKIEFLLLK